MLVKVLPIIGLTEKILTSADGTKLTIEEMLAEDYLRQTIQPLAALGLVEFLAVPFRHRGETAGLIALSSLHRDSYNEADLPILKEIADQIADELFRMSDT